MSRRDDENSRRGDTRNNEPGERRRDADARPHQQDRENNDGGTSRRGLLLGGGAVVAVGSLGGYLVLEGLSGGGNSGRRSNGGTTGGSQTTAVTRSATSRETSRTGPLFEDEFTTNTLSNYELEKDFSSGGSGLNQVRYGESAEALFAELGDNQNLYVTPTEVTPPAKGRFQIECTPVKQYSSGVRVGAKVRFEDGSKIRGSAITSTWDARDKVLFVDSDGPTRERKTTPTLRMDERQTVTFEWSPDGVTLQPDGNSLGLDVDLSQRNPTSVGIWIVQGHVNIHSVMIT